MNELEKYIHKLHYRTFDKIWSNVHEKYPDATKEEVKNIINTFIKDPPNLKNQKKMLI